MKKNHKLEKPKRKRDYVSKDKLTNGATNSRNYDKGNVKSTIWYFKKSLSGSQIVNTSVRRGLKRPSINKIVIGKLQSFFLNKILYVPLVSLIKLKI